MFSECPLWAGPGPGTTDVRAASLWRSSQFAGRKTGKHRTLNSHIAFLRLGSGSTNLGSTSSCFGERGRVASPSWTLVSRSGKDTLSSLVSCIFFPCIMSLCLIITVPWEACRVDNYSSSNSTTIMTRIHTCHWVLVLWVKSCAKHFAFIICCNPDTSHARQMLLSQFYTWGNWGL